MTIYEIDKAIEQMLNNSFVFNEETGEIDTLLSSETLEMMLDDKFEAYGLYIKNLNADVEAIDKEIKTLMTRKKEKAKQSECLSNIMMDFMLKHGRKKVETPKVLVTTRNSKRVIIDDEEALLNYCKEYHKDDCYTLEVKYKPIKSAIKKAIDDFEGMAHIETNTSINIK